MHFVYILYSASMDRFYIGESARPEERLKHHLAGQQFYTRRATDWVPVFRKAVPNRTEALRIERLIKKSKSRKTILRWIRGLDNQLDATVWQNRIPR